MDIRKELTSKLVPPPGKVQQSKTTFNASRGLALSAIGANVRSSPMAIKAAIKNASDAELKKAYELCAGIKESDHVMDLILQRLNVDEETRERVGKKTDTGGLSRARRLPSGSSKETKRDFARRVHRDKYQDPLERKSQIRKEKSAEKKRMSKRKETFGEGLSPEKKETA